MNRDKNKKVLCIADVFPPSGGVATNRISAFVRFLPEYGWEPIVLTPKSKFYKWLDESLMKYIPTDTLVFRTSSLEQNIFLKFLQSISYSKKNIFGKMCYIIYQLFTIPDIRIWWAPFTIREGVRLCKKYNVDVIYATAPRFSSCISAYVISKITHKPYILDMRDPWTLNDLWGPLVRASKELDSTFDVLVKYLAINKLKFEGVLEHLLFKNASYVIFVGKTICHSYQKKYLPLANKFVEISNGFQPEDLERVNNPQIGHTKTNKKIISYVGALYPFRFPHTLIAALREIYKTYPDISEKLKILFVGFVDPNIVEQIEKEDFQNVISYTGEITRDEAMNYMVSSDALLLLCSDSAWEQPAKIFDYMASKRPIIAITSKNGEVERIINETKTGIVINHGDVKKAIDVIMDTLSNVNKPAIMNKKAIDKYNRRCLTKQLAFILDDVQ